MTAKKGMSKDTIAVNREVWLSEVERIKNELGCTKAQLSKLVAPERSESYITTLKTKNPRIAHSVVSALGKLGADTTAILDCEEEKPEDLANNVVSEQLETIISLLKTIVDIWGGNHEQSV